MVIEPDGPRIKLKPTGVRCPNLVFRSGRAFCLVHEEPWFKFTPCHSHGNPEIDPDSDDRPCAYGSFTKEQILRGTTEEPLEDCGPLRWNEEDGIL